MLNLSVLAEPTGRLGSTVSCGMHANREHGNCQPVLETTVKSSQLVYERLCFVSPRLAHLECGFQPAVMTETDFDEFNFAQVVTYASAVKRATRESTLH